MATDRLAEALEQYINTEDWEQGRRVVEDNQELLTDEALALLVESVGDYRRANRDEVADYLREHLAVLERSRQVGIDQAFREASGRAREALEARRRQLAGLRPKSPTPIQAAVWELLEAENPEQVDRALGGHPELAENEEALDYLDDLMRRAEEADYDEAMRLLREYHQLLQAYYELPPLLQALQELTAVPTWTEAREIFERHPELLSDEAIQSLDSLISEAEAQGDAATALALVAYRELLARSREVGPERALEELQAAQGQPQG